MSEISEFELYTEFLEVASAFVLAEDSEVDEEFFNEESGEHGLEEKDDLEEENDDDTSINIMQCIINLIDLEYILQSENPKVRRKGEKRWGVHPLNQLRREQGHFDNLFKEMLTHDHEKFFNFTRMTPERFQHLFEMIEFKITKSSPNAIPAKCRLLLTLRYTFDQKFSQRKVQVFSSLLQFSCDWRFTEESSLQFSCWRVYCVLYNPRDL